MSTRLAMSRALFVLAALALAGCPRPLPDVPAPADLAALDARLTGEPSVSVRIELYSAASRSPVAELRLRLGPGDRVALDAAGTLGGHSLDDARLPDDASRARAVRWLLQRGAASLARELADTPGAPLPPLPAEVPGLRTAGWEPGGDARGLLFPSTVAQTVLWLDDETGLPLRRETELLVATDTPAPPVEVYTEWAFAPAE